MKCKYCSEEMPERGNFCPICGGDNSLEPEIIIDPDELTFGEAFNALPLLLAEEVIEIGDYLKNLLLLYVFAGIGAVGTLWRAIKKN